MNVEQAENRTDADELEAYLKADIGDLAAKAGDDNNRFAKELAKNDMWMLFAGISLASAVIVILGVLIIGLHVLR